MIHHRVLQRSVRLALALAGIVIVAACAPSAPVSPPAPVRAGAAPQIVPAPASLIPGIGAPFEVTAASGINVVGSDSDAAAIGEHLGALLRRATGFPVPVTASAANPASRSIELRLAPDLPELGEEGYRLTVTADSLRLVAHSPAGLFRGTETIRQLLPADIESEVAVARGIWPIPALTIADQPRFAWRGAMLDVARHFFTVREVEQYIDLLAMYKLNVLHLHLSDDQGWRIEIKSRPRLTAVGAATQVGGGPGGFYTQREYQDIVAYARARYITVVPEIDMPAHTNAALVAYPELSCSTRPTALYTGTDVGWSTFCVDSEATYALIDDIVREISAITPGPYFHIGGDEVKALTDQQYIRFVERVQDIVARYGKRMVGWEEISKARIKPSTLAQQWKSDSATSALKYGAKLILSPARKAYLDMKYTPATELGLSWAGVVEVSDAYDWDPALYIPGVTERDIVGVEAPIWSETIRNITAAEYLAMPRLAALAEVGWTPQAQRDWQSFRSRLAAQAPRWRYMGVNYYPSPQIPW